MLTNGCCEISGRQKLDRTLTIETAPLLERRNHRKLTRVRASTAQAGLEMSFLVHLLESLPDQGLGNAVQVGLRVGKERGVFVVVRVDDERLRCGDEPEID